jgi:hypothetical protein
VIGVKAVAAVPSADLEMEALKLYVVGCPGDGLGGGGLG